MGVVLDKPSKYKLAIIDCMKELSKEKNIIFFGQQVRQTDFYGTLSKVPFEKRFETPVAEELQVGMAIGYSLFGFKPVCIIQRMDFLPRCADQIINHLDKLKVLSEGLYAPKVLIRTTIGSKTPIDAGLQHTQDLTLMFKSVLKEVKVCLLKTPREIYQCYSEAKKFKSSFLIIEHQDLYKRI